MRQLLALAFLFALAPVLQAQQNVVQPPLILRPGDVVHVTLLREPDRSGQFTVDERGMAVLPILGNRMVTGGPWPLVRDSLLREYARELADNSVSVVGLQRVFVLGSVKAPGVFFAEPSMSIAGAVALAGGATPEGDLRRVRVVRDGVTVIDQLQADAPMGLTGVRSGDQIYVDRRGWFDRNSSTAVSAAVGLLGVIVTVLIVR